MYMHMYMYVHTCAHVYAFRTRFQDAERVREVWTYEMLVQHAEYLCMYQGALGGTLRKDPKSHYLIYPIYSPFIPSIYLGSRYGTVVLPISYKGPYSGSLLKPLACSLALDDASTQGGLHVAFASGRGRNISNNGLGCIGIVSYTVNTPHEYLGHYFLLQEAELGEFGVRFQACGATLESSFSFLSLCFTPNSMLWL